MTTLIPIRAIDLAQSVDRRAQPPRLHARDGDPGSVPGAILSYTLISDAASVTLATGAWAGLGAAYGAGCAEGILRASHHLNPNIYSVVII